MPKSAIIRLLVWIAPFALIIGIHSYLLGPMAVGVKAPGFRDSAFMYYPLFRWIDRQNELGEIPFWNPDDNFGVPVVEDATTSMFYPGKAIFLFRALPYASRFGLYVYLHSLLAAFGAFWLAHVLRANRAGATLAAISFSLSGSVLFQVCNIVFLVGAAWLPWSLGCWWLLIRKRKRAMVPWTAMTLAMMALAGDPQMAYHSALLGGLLIGQQFWSHWSRGILKDAAGQLLKNLLGFGLVGVFSVSLAAIQLLPTASYSKFSERNRQAGEAPRSLFEIPSALGDLAQPDEESTPLTTKLRDGFLKTPKAETHHRDIYDFSIPPWALTQLIWPNNTGKWLPVFRRWTLPFRGVPKIWTPSLYLGILPALLGLLAFRFRGRNRASVWLSWSTLLFLLGSLGVYGLGWAIQFIANWFGVELLKDTHGAVGGLYWFFVVLFPKYVVFRYPAKLFVVATLGISILAARQMRARALAKSKWLRPAAFMLLAATLLAAMYVLLPAFGFQEGISKIGAHETYGPFDASGCVRDILTGLGSTMTVLAFLLVALMLYQKGSANAKQVLIGVVMVTSLEILLANGWLVLTVQSDSIDNQPESVAKLRQRFENEFGGKFQGPPHRIMRFSRDHHFPHEWATTSSKSRLDEIIRWQRESLYPKFHLLDDLSLVGSFNSIEPSAASMDFMTPNLVYSNPWYAPAKGNENLQDYDLRVVLMGFGEEADNEFWNQFEPLNAYESNEFSIRILPRDPLAERRMCIPDRMSNGRYLLAPRGIERNNVLIPMAWAPGWTGQWLLEDGSLPCRIRPYNESCMIVEEIPDSVIAAFEKNPKKCFIELRYRPKNFDRGVWISAVAWHLLLAYITFALLTAIRNRRPPG